MKTFLIILGFFIFLYFLISKIVSIRGREKQTYTPPPSLKNKIRVYVSSPLFNMSDLYYSIGQRGLTSTASASIASDNVKSSSSELLGKIFKNTLNIPYGGIVEEIAKRGWECYSPARDGFNLAAYIGTTSTNLGTILKGNDKNAKTLKDLGVTEADIPLTGSYLLMAVYAFDMYNLINRCNCFIFNSAGITMDDGSVAELGIASVRGLPIAIHSPEDVSLFAGGIINPMVAGAGSTDLRVQKWKYLNIKDVCDALERKIENILESQEQEYYRTTPPPKNIAFWSQLGSHIWNFKFKKLTVDQNGVVDEDKSINTEFRLNNSNEKGKAFIGGYIIGLVKQTLTQFNFEQLI